MAESSRAFSNLYSFIMLDEKGVYLSPTERKIYPWTRKLRIYSSINADLVPSSVPDYLKIVVKRHELIVDALLSGVPGPELYFLIDNERNALTHMKRVEEECSNEVEIESEANEVDISNIVPFYRFMDEEEHSLRNSTRNTSEIATRLAANRVSASQISTATERFNMFQGVNRRIQELIDMKTSKDQHW